MLDEERGLLLEKIDFFFFREKSLHRINDVAQPEDEVSLIVEVADPFFFLV